MEHGEFVTRKGSKLYLNGNPFRFAGPNIYWLGLDENVGGIDWPTPFRIVNALDTAKEMGATVVRAHTLGASHGHPKSIMPELGQFNEEALRRVDFVIREAKARQLRLVIPFVCNWSYYHGGRETFVKWRGLTDYNDFYHNREVVEDFKAYIEVLLNRVNSYTGVCYKDDPTIMAWELGNELNDSPPSWVQEIVDYIKGIDSNHLVAHGKQFGVDEDKLEVNGLDIVDVHYYPADGNKMRNDAQRITAADKVYIAGEYGWPDAELNQFFEEAESNEQVSGTLFWSLFGHDDEGGYVQHLDGFTVHYPGIGGGVDISQRVLRMRTHAFTMSGSAIPSESVPLAPEIIEAGNNIRFRGVVGAAYYTIEKSVNGKDGPWAVVYDKRPADYAKYWIDPLRIQSLEAWYRIKAYNSSGVPGEYSPVYHSRTLITM